jgi:Protein of unknown function (DUF2586)
MATPQITFVIGNGGLGRTNPTQDSVCGLITTGIATTATASTAALPLNTSLRLTSVKDAEAYGLSKAYDVTNSVLVYYHIKEFFRMNSNGVLWLRLAAQTASMADLALKANANAKQLLRDANGEINTLAISRNPATGYTATITAGIDADVTSAIDNAQALATEELDEKRPVHILIEGRSASNSASTIADQRARTIAAPNVSVTIAKDKGGITTYLGSLPGSSTILAAHAAVGTVLGCISLAKVNESIGWTGKFNLLDAQNFQVPAIGNGFTEVQTLSQTDLNSINDKGYIFAMKRPAASGTYINDNPSCVALASDYAYLAEDRVVNKAVKLSYVGLFPFISSPLALQGGLLAPGTVAEFESAVRQALNQMVVNGEVSEFSVYVNPAQNVLATSKLNIVLRIVPYGTARTIEVNVGLATTL